MEAKKIIDGIIENHNNQPIQQKIELKKETGKDFVQMEFGIFPNNTFIVKEWSSEKELDFEHLEKRGYQSIIDYIIRKSINL